MESVALGTFHTHQLLFKSRERKTVLGGGSVEATMRDELGPQRLRNSLSKMRRLLPWGPLRKNFSCWDQCLAIAFAQLTYRESLRDIETCLGAVGGKLYHMGFRTTVARSTLADANESRDWQIFAGFAQTLIATARNNHCTDVFANGLATSRGDLPR
jgi:hypothetical protein